MRKLFGLALGLVLVLYPIGVFYGIQHFGARSISAGLLALFVLRYLLQRKQAALLNLTLLPLATVLGGLFCLIVFVVDRAEWLKFYPILMNAFFLSLFATSLKNPPPVIERLARLQYPDLPPRGVVHTRQVTVAWCVFFAANGLAALYTALYTTMEIWTFYNGLLSYILMALMFVVEYPIRAARMAQDKREAQKSC